ncbi:MAG: porin [Betaproteobacteria bacterium]|nr:porin [Betaproteobacteria bacterium]
MQKKLIALAVAGLLSAPAFAQSNVTLYGSIDFGYVNLGKNAIDGIGNRNAIDSGISKNNRIGFKGTEDLGDGLKAVFVLETGLSGDQTGMFKDGNARQTYAGLAGGFGTVAFGRQYTPQHLFTSAVDPFGKQGLGSAGNVLLQDKRLNNLAAYISPNWGGFSFIAGWTWNGLGEENWQNNGDARIWAIAPSFTWENLFVGANYHSAKLNFSQAPDVSALRAYDLYASYDFGFVKVGGTIGQRVTKKEVTGAVRDTKVLQWMLGATFKVTASDSILASYARARENDYDNAGVRSKLGQWAIGYEHALTKRTVLYAQFAIQQQNDAFRQYGFGGSITTDAPVGSVASSYAINPSTPAATADYRRGFAVGFRHDF